MNDIKVAIVGAGHSGLHTAHFLAKAGIEPIMLIEAECIARLPEHSLRGTSWPEIPFYSRLLTSMYDSFYDEFCSIHGIKRAALFLKAGALGRNIITNIADEITAGLYRREGSLMVGTTAQLSLLKQEKYAYENNGFKQNLAYYTQKEIGSLYPGTNFQNGLFISDDAILDNKRYIAGLENKLKEAGVFIAENTKVTGITETKEGFIVQTDNRGEISADYAVLATNGMYIDKNLEGLLENRWAFVACYEDIGVNTPNTWNAEKEWHYWARQDNVLMIGGEDRPVLEGNTRSYVFKCDDPTEKIQIWAKKTFPSIAQKPRIAEHFGIFAYTSDKIPIIGKFDQNSRISYIVGCNGCLASLMAFGASLLPGILGYSELNAEQKEFIELLSPNRKTLQHHPA